MRHGPKLLRYECHQRLRNQVRQSLVKRDVTSAFGGWVGESQDSFSKWECGRSHWAEKWRTGHLKWQEKMHRWGEDQSQMYSLVHNY